MRMNGTHDGSFRMPGNRVSCIYCGETIPDDVAECPACGAPSHFQRKGFRKGVQGRFMLVFLLLALASLCLALWLPR